MTFRSLVTGIPALSDKHARIAPSAQTGHDRIAGEGDTAGTTRETVMTRALVVHHDIDIADQEADSLRRRGYEVEQCWGPIYTSCPLMRGDPCVAVERADVLVYDVWSTGEAGGARNLVENLRRYYPHTPVVLTAPGIELDWVNVEGRASVVPLEGVPTGAKLESAIGEALHPFRPSGVATFHGPGA